MWERWERCLIPLGISGGEHFPNNTPAYNRKFCSARWESDIPDSAEPRTDALRYPWSVPGKIQTQIRAGNCSAREKGRSLLRSQPWDNRIAEHLVLLPNSAVRGCHHPELLAVLSMGGFFSSGCPQGCVHPPVPTLGWFLLDSGHGGVPRAELRDKTLVQGTFVVTGTPSSASPELSWVLRPFGVGSVHGHLQMMPKIPFTRLQFQLRFWNTGRFGSGDSILKSKILMKIQDLFQVSVHFPV